MNNDLLKLIRNDFSSLWSCESTGDTTRIFVPMQSCVEEDNGICVYISKRDSEWIISDGGYLSNPSHHEDRGVPVWIMDLYKVRVTMGNSEWGILYKKTDCETLISARVFDMIHFIQTVCICRRHDKECGSND